jgi:precorrin-6B methylase 2
MSSAVTGKEWADRHLREGEEWIESYWQSRDHPHRSFLIERISQFSPIHSILEIGCASGPNLYRVAKNFPEAEVKGIDVSSIAVQKGNEWFKREGILNVRLELGKAQELERFRDKSFDVVFTDAVLIYIPPDEIRQVAKEMLRISRVVVLNEWHLFNKWRAFLVNEYCYFKLKLGGRLLSKQKTRDSDCYLIPRSSSLGYFVGHWIRDYGALFKEFVPREKIRIIRPPKELWGDKNWQRWSAVIEVIQQA